MVRRPALPASKVSDFYEQAVEVIFELEFYQDAKKYLDCHLPQIEVGSNSKHLKLLRHLRFQPRHDAPWFWNMRSMDWGIFIGAALILTG